MTRVPNILVIPAPRFRGDRVAGIHRSVVLQKTLGPRLRGDDGEETLSVTSFRKLQ